MAVLSKDEYFNAISGVIGTDTSESALAFIENMTDTYNKLEQEATGKNGQDWQQKYEELDKAWAARYRNRFFTGTSALPTETQEETDTVNERITIDNLFT